MRQLKITKIWRSAQIVAFPKPEKPLGYLKSYRSISLLFVPFNILERLIYVSTHCSHGSRRAFDTGFRHGRSTVDQVNLLTQDIDDSFSAKKKAGAVFVDLTAAYNTVWHCGLISRLLRLLPDRNMVHMIMEMAGNRSFTLTTKNGKRSRSQHLGNGVPQVSVLAPLIFNTFISDVPNNVSRKYSMHMLMT